MKITVEIPAQVLADTLCAAVENNHMTAAWSTSVEAAGGFRKVAKKMEPAWWYAEAASFDGRDILFDVTEIVDESKEPVGANLRTHRVNLAKLRAGLKIMAEKHPRHFGDMLRENGDAITADVFLQCVALGEVRYG